MTSTPRQVVVFAPYAYWTPHLETDLEVSDQLLAAGDHVRWLVCDADMETCEPNPTCDPAVCETCMARRTRGLAFLAAPVRTERLADFLTPQDRARVDEMPMAVDDLATLRARTIEGFDVGLAALSSVIWHLRDDAIDLQRHAEALRRYMRTGAWVYFAMRVYLRVRPTDLVVLFNGRMAPLRGALRACQELGVHCRVHERGHSFGHYLLTDGDMPHMIEKQLARIRAGWEDPETPREEKERIARHWYEERAQGRSADGFVFTDRQESGRLPPGWNDDRRNVAVFTSSEWEIHAVTDEWLNPLYPTSVQGIARIIEEAGHRAPDMHFTVRIHPNREGADSGQVRQFLSLSGDNVTVVAPDDPVCSYTLLRHCEKVLVTGSTLGAEATYWGKPAVLAGQAVWRTLGCAHAPTSHAEVMSCLLRPDLPVASVEGALMYAYDRATFGQPFEHFVPTGVDSGTYRGRAIRPADWDRWPFANLPSAGRRHMTPEVNFGILGAKATADASGQRLTVRRVLPNGPATEEFLGPGDVVVGVGREATPMDEPLVPALARALIAEDRVRLVVARQGAALEVLRIRLPIKGPAAARDPRRRAVRQRILSQAVAALAVASAHDPEALDPRTAAMQTLALHAARPRGEASANARAVADAYETVRAFPGQSVVLSTLREGLAAFAKGWRARRAFWATVADALTLAQAPDGTLQPAHAPTDAAQFDLGLGEVWTTAGWALLLACDPALRRTGLPE